MCKDCHMADSLPQFVPLPVDPNPLYVALRWLCNRSRNSSPLTISFGELGIAKSNPPDGNPKRKPPAWANHSGRLNDAGPGYLLSIARSLATMRTKIRGPIQLTAGKTSTLF